MSTLFGRGKKHRSRTTSTGSDSLEGSVPYSRTSTPAAPPVPRQSISNDGAPLHMQASRSSVASTSSARPVSPSLRDITPPVNLIPEHLPYEHGMSQRAQSASGSRDTTYSSSGSVKRSKTPDVGHRAEHLLQRHASAASADGNASISSNGSRHHDSHPRRQPVDRLTLASFEATPGRARSSISIVGGTPGRDSTPRPSSRSGHNADTQSSRSSAAASLHRRDTVSSTQSRGNESNASSAPPYSPNMRSIGTSAGQVPHYPYNASASQDPSERARQAALRASQASGRSVVSQRSSASLNTSRIGPPTPSLTAAEFVFPRPSSDEDIEGLFEDLLQRTDVPVRDRDGMRNWPVPKKWTIIYNDRLQDWNQARKGGQSERTTPQMISTPVIETTPVLEQNATFGAGIAAEPNSKMALQRGKTESPEWYLTKFMDGSIKWTDVQSLTVGLRTYEIAWAETFVNKLHGLSVLTNALSNICRLSVPRKEQDLKLEIEIVKCLKHLLQMQMGLDAAMSHPQCIINITLDICSPSVQARKLVMDMLTFLSYQGINSLIGHSYVLKGLDNLQTIKNDHGRFDAWFTMLEATLDGRGKMGSLVGASEEIKTLRGREAQYAMQAANEAAGTVAGDNALAEYCWSNCLFINAIVLVPAELEVRMHLRGQMEASGLGRILDKMRTLRHSGIDRQIDNYEDRAEQDHEEFSSQFREDILRDFQDPWDILRALLSTVEGSRAYDFLLSALQHLLFIREEGETRVRYFQLIDRLVTAIVMDRKAVEKDFSSIVNKSVASMAAQFADQARSEEVEEKNRVLKGVISKLNREKKELEQDMSRKDDGLVGELKTQLFRTEEDLAVSRQTSEMLRAKVEDLDKLHKKRMAQQDLQVRELFNMLKECRVLEVVADEEGVLDRHELMTLMEKKMERVKTIQRLEGRHLGSKGPSVDDTDDWQGFTGRKASKIAASEANVPGNRDTGKSMFEDADDQAVRLHIEQSLANGAAQLGLPEDRPYYASPQQSTRARDRMKNTPSPSGIRPHIYYSPSSFATRQSRDHTPMPSKAQQNLATLQEASPTGRPRFGVGNGMPSSLLAAIRSRAVSGADGDSSSDGGTTRGSGSLLSSDSIETTRTIATSLHSRQASSSNATPERPPKSHRRTPTNEAAEESPSANLSGRADARSHVQYSATPTKAVPPAPPPPPAPPAPPPLPPGLLGGLIPPPPPPPPKSASSLNSMASGTSPLADMLAAQASRLKDGGKVVRNDAVVGPAGSSLSPPPERGTFKRPPLAPVAPGAPPPPGLKLAGGIPKASLGAGKAAQRKDTPFIARTQMKQLNWQKVNLENLGRTIWNKQDFNEEEWAQKLKEAGIFDEMENLFQAKKPVAQSIAKHKKDLKSVLTYTQQQAIEIILKHHASGETIGEKITFITSRIYSFDEKLCTQHFLDELQRVLPDPTLQGKLNGHGTDTEEELARLHPADRFLVELMKLGKIHMRVKGMHYKVTFDEAYKDVKEGASTITNACEALRHAPAFERLLQLVLLVGNIHNGLGHNGGAFGFKINSLNKLMDTKASSGLTWLHFLEKNISSGNFGPEVQQFLQEIEKPSEASRVSLEEVRKGLAQLRSGLSEISAGLEHHFTDALVEEGGDDGYAAKMFGFRGRAEKELPALADRVTMASGAFSELLELFDEDDKTTTTEFFGYVNIFVASYKRVAAENAKRVEEETARESRRAKAAASKKEKEKTMATVGNSRDGQQLDDLLQQLRVGDVHRATKGRARQAHAGRLQRQSLSNGQVLSPPTSAGRGILDNLNNLRSPGTTNDLGDQARDLLAQISGKDDTSLSPTSPQFRAKRERRALQPLFPEASSAMGQDTQSTSSANPPSSSKSGGRSLSTLDEGETSESRGEKDSSDSSPDSDDNASDIDDNRSQFAADFLADGSNGPREPEGTVQGGAVTQEDEDGDVTMRLRNHLESSAEDKSDEALKPTTSQAQEEEDLYLSDLSDDEAVAARLAY